MQDFFLVTCICILALMGHGAVKQKPFRWIVRIVIIGTIFFELVSMAASEELSPFGQTVLISMLVANSVLLFIHGRKIISAFLTTLDGVASLRFITVPLRNKELAAKGGTRSEQAGAPVPGDLHKESASAQSASSSASPAPNDTTPSASSDASAGADPSASPGADPSASPSEPVSSAPVQPQQKSPSVLQKLFGQIIFIPTSYPHMVRLFVYVVALGSMLQQVSPASMDFPSIPIPLPVSLQQLFSYNGLGLVMLSFCGVGIFVSRDWKAAFKRLGWEKPKLSHVGIGLGLVVFSFCYDLAWSLITHAAPGQDMATKLSGYNSGTFASGADLSASILLAFATAICAGVGEETLTRGALQPALGIVPAAVLHGVLHAQFSHAPILIIQIAIWSIVFGIVRRFTSTTTTIIGHAGFNFVTTFLFAFNP